MSRILITGATGNIGYEVIRYLTKIGTPNTIVAGVRNIDRARDILKNFPNIEFAQFDFEDPNTFGNALEGIDRLFLLRPPHISNVKKYFTPLILKVKERNIRQIVFLSVQGAEKSKVIPHNKIEQLILENRLEYIFLRPSYFMQNLITTLINDIHTKQAIILPAGNAKFNWVDIENIGEVGAILLDRFNEYKNQAFEITGLENETFEKVTELINSIAGNPIKYVSVSPFEFYRIKKRDGLARGLIMVMILLHLLPRFQKEPKISEFYKILTGKAPTTLSAFIEREKDFFTTIK